MQFFIKEHFMKLTASVGMAIAFYLCAAIQAQITGRVIDRVGNPIAGATVTLKIKNKTAQSDATGVFTVITTGIISQRSAINKSTLYFNGPCLVFTNEMPQQLTIEIFDMAGKRVCAAFSRLFGKGTFSLPTTSLISRQSADGLYIARISNGTNLHIVPFCPTLNILRSSGPTAKIESPQMLAKKLATADTLIVSKQNYTSVSKGIANIDQGQNVGDITLKSSEDDAIEKKVDSLRSFCGC